MTVRSYTNTLRLIIATIIVLDLFLLVYISLGELSLSIGLYASILMLGNLLIPASIAVLIYVGLKKFIAPSSGLAILALNGLLTLLFLLGLLTWSALDLIIYYGGIDELTIENIISDFKKEFLGFVPITIATAIGIPLIDKYLLKKIFA